MLSPPCIFLGNATADINLSLIAVLFLLHSFVNRDFAWLKESWVRLALTLWAYFLIRSAFTEYPSEAFNRIAPWGRFPVFAAAIAYWLLRSEDMRRLVFLSLGATVTFATFDIFFQYIFHIDIFGYKPEYQAEVTRLTAVSGNQNIGTLLAWVSFPVIISFLQKASDSQQKVPNRLLFFALTLAIFIAVALTNERMAILLMGFGLAMVTIFCSSVRKMAMLIMLVLAAAIAIISTSNRQISDNLTRRTSSVITNYLDSHYGHLFINGMLILKDNPVFGIGPKHFRYHCPLNIETDKNSPICDENKQEKVILLHPHNIYIELLSETGLVGAGLFIAMIICWVWKFWRNRKYVFGSIVFGMGLSVAFRLIPTAGSASFHIAWSISPMWLMLGMGLAWILWEGKINNPPSHNNNSLG